MVSLEQLQAGIVLPIDKPRQWTSFQAVNKIKSILRKIYQTTPLLPGEGLGVRPKFKIGHAGTLDPLATGLLLVCIGKATKTIPTLQDGDKVYTGTFVFGAPPPGAARERAVDHYYPYEHITPALLEQTLPQFTGTILQVPPMFSAVKIAGQRAYEYARLDDPSVVIQPKPVTVYSFEITAFRGGEVDKLNVDKLERPVNVSTYQRINLYKSPLGEVPPQLPQADFRIHCGKGTYIRSIARDLGLALGSGAFLSALRREQIGTYTVDQALQFDQVEDFLTM